MIFSLVLSISLGGAAGNRKNISITMCVCVGGVRVRAYIHFVEVLWYYNGFVASSGNNARWHKANCKRKRKQNKIVVLPYISIFRGNNLFFRTFGRVRDGKVV